MAISKKDSKQNISKVNKGKSTQTIKETEEKKKLTHLDITRNDQTIKNWLDDINARPSTRKNFTSSMAMYTEFTGLTPAQLLEEAEKDAGLPVKERKLKRRIVSFRVHLQEQEISEHTVRSRLTAVKSFYSANEILMPKIKFEKPTTLSENDIIPTKEDLQDCLSICDPLEKAVILTGISSGLASNELRSLKLQQFLDGYDKDTGITKLPNMYRKKTKAKFTTFLSPECSKAILEYIEYRNRPTKGQGIVKQQQREKQYTTKNSYLFIVKSVPDTYLETRDEEIRKMGENALFNLYKGISEKARKNTDKGYNFIRSHTMRKYFNNTLISEGCDSFYREYWMGHKLSDTQEAYFRVNVQAQKELYKKYIPYLTIQKELDISASPDFKTAIEERDHYKALAEKYFIDGFEIIYAKQAEAELKLKAFKALSKEDQEKELIKAIRELDFSKIPPIKPNATPEEKSAYEKMVIKEKEYAERMNKMRDATLKQFEEQKKNKE
ncbi:tyrosine-type recombinase/integrase [Methanosarcina mazei]|uniref:Tyr recombinase domain-containing protein n=1 Tax=Methanosarcina mazei TaxID=2209 RepID=A0A0F8RVA7_METMZ|nr:site-specific integrase [Methanosarcina mazei]KKG07014.1 hypothetical protein DU47_04185 [Methanosarcina mazei]KKH91398.1 hypothetical protein DU80_11690 [Methanosarcina mazei]